MLSVKFDVPNAVSFGKVMSVQSCCGMSMGVLGMAPFRQKETPKCLSKNEGQLFVTSPLQLVEAFEVEIGGGVNTGVGERQKNPPTHKKTTKQPKEKGTLKNMVFFSKWFSLLLLESSLLEIPSESLAGLLSANTSPGGLMYQYYGGDHYHTDCETSFTCKAVASCTNKLLICPLKYLSAEELTSKWLGICIMLYGLKAGTKKQESLISTAALAFVSLLPLNIPCCCQ